MLTAVAVLAARLAPSFIAPASAGKYPPHSFAQKKAASNALAAITAARCCSVLRMGALNAR